jgi:hypothetical protein
MKKSWGLLLIVTFFVFPLYANAGIIGNVTLQEYYSSPTGGVTFPTISGNYYLDYDVSLNYGPIHEAFCVENADGPGYGNPNVYTLLSLDSGLSAFGLDAQRYLAAAWIADKYLTTYAATDTTEAWKAGAQIAVWEIIFDGVQSTLGLGAGTFQSSIYNSQANSLWTGHPTTPFNSNSHWALAVNPPITSGDVNVEKYQNYLVPAVPEPATLLLMGFGSAVMGGGIRRLRKKFKKA